MRKPYASYHDHLIKALRNREEARHYLNAALEDGDRRVFLIALRNVAEAQGGLTRAAKLAGLNRENLYRMLSEKGNPEYTGLGKLLGALGFRLSVEKRPQPRLK